MAGADCFFRRLAALLMALLFIIVISALQRIRLYQTEYGLTEPRFFTTAFMGWLAVVFVWFVATVLRDHRERFAAGDLISGLLATGLLNGLNPDAFIARVNLDRMPMPQTDAGRPRAQRAFDAYYPTSLSADAVPILVEGLPAMNAQHRRVVARSLLDRWPDTHAPDWRTWNWGRYQAREAVRAKRGKSQAITAQGGQTSRSQRGWMD